MKKRNPNIYIVGGAVVISRYQPCAFVLHRTAAPGAPRRPSTDEILYAGMSKNGIVRLIDPNTREISDQIRPDDYIRVHLCETGDEAVVVRDTWNERKKRQQERRSACYSFLEGSKRSPCDTVRFEKETP